MTGLALEARSLCKAFGSVVVADSIDLALEPGARHALIGPNGAGKTSFVHMLSGVLAPSSGTIFMFGSDVTGEGPAQRAKRGLVRTFQISNLFQGLTVLENVFMAVSEHTGTSGRMFRAAGRQRDLIERCERILEQLHLTDVISHRVAEVAYGTRRLVEIAVALALEPKVLLLDEPAAGVPGNEFENLFQSISNLPKDIAILMIEHDMQIVRRFASSVSVLVHGKLLMTGPPAQVMAAPEVRSAYLGKAGTVRFETAGRDDRNS